MSARLLHTGYFAIALLCLPTVVSAQQWPDRPIRIFVAQGAGGGQDTIIRFIADKVSPIVGQQIIVENRPGAGAIIGMQAAARAPADGYNFAMTSSAAMASNPHLVKALPYDPLKDFTPVALLTRPGFAISVNAKLPIKTLADIVEIEKKTPGKLSAVIDGPRNATGLTAAYLNKVTGANIRLVPYTSSAQGLQDTIGGNVDIYIQTTGLHVPHINAGNLRPIAVSGNRREPSLPQVPTVGESYPGFSLVGWLMISAPTGTPKEAVDKMNGAFDRVLKDPVVVEWMLKFGSPSNGGAGTLDELNAFVRNEIDYWGKVVKTIGLEPM